jgi:hypothetical protein
MSEQPTDIEIIETPPPDALIPGPGAGIPLQPVDGPQPDQEPHFEAEEGDGRVGASTAWTATRALNTARSHLGFREGRNNQNPFWQWPPNYRWLANAAYCASAQSYVAWTGGGQTGLNAIGGGHYNCAEWVSWGKRHGTFHTGTPRPGDLVMFDWSGRKSYAEHVGIVESYTPGYVTAIEFNTLSGNGGNQSDGGGCYRRTRSTKWVVGYVRPSYGGSTDVAPIAYHPAGTKITLAVDGDWGLNTTRRLQQFTSLTQDGDLGPNTRKAFQRVVGVSADGDWGPATHKALQRLVRVTQDGVWGPATITAWQKWLNAQAIRRAAARRALLARLTAFRRAK